MLVQCRLRAEANDLHRMGVDAVAKTFELKTAKARRAVQQAHMKALRASLADDLTGGLCIMLVAALYCAVSYGFLQIRLGRCGAGLEGCA